MKGIVFTEFLDFVADRYGEDTVDDIIDASELPSAGAYTATLEGRSSSQTASADS